MDSFAVIGHAPFFTLATLSRNDIIAIDDIMGEWKMSVTLRIRPALRAEMVEFATREQRSLGNLGAVLLEWAFEQLKTAGSLERLRKYKIWRNVK